MDEEEEGEDDSGFMCSAVWIRVDVVQLLVPKAATSLIVPAATAKRAQHTKETELLRRLLLRRNFR